MKDIKGKRIKPGDLVIRDKWFISLVEFVKDAYVLTDFVYPENLTDYHTVATFYDNWDIYKKQSLEIIARGIL